jgi:hypothetical protein
MEFFEPQTFLVRRGGGWGEEGKTERSYREVCSFKPLLNKWVTKVML